MACDSFVGRRPVSIEVELARSRKRDASEGLAGKDLLDELEGRIERLRISYEQYFVGVERTPPLRDAENVQKLVRRLERTRLGSTVLRFRLQGLRARLVTYQNYWTRVLNQIEAGTYRRDLFRRPGPISEVDTSSTSADSDLSLPGGMTADEVRRLHQDLVAAKTAAGESTTGLTIDSLAKKLAREVPRLQERHRCDGVRFEVATRAGRVHLRARPR